MKKKILITDDEIKLAEAMKIRFENVGYEVVLAVNGEEGIEKAKAEKPDLIIMDIAMPKMDGYTAVKLIKKDESTKHIPIIMVTGKDQMEEIFIMEGVKEYVVKPFEFDNLIEKITRLLGESGSQNQ
jgi:DNA-binding response OmpR family regulator